jgi:hypothetical protein
VTIRFTFTAGCQLTVPSLTTWAPAETQKVFDGGATFRDSTDLVVDVQGDPDRAGFVQVMQGRPATRNGRSNMAHDPETWAAFRPDVIGTVEVGYDDGACTVVMYFSSEAEAEACSGERLEVLLEWRAAMDEMDKISVGESEFLDLKQPLMRSAPRST